MEGATLGGSDAEEARFLRANGDRGHFAGVNLNRAVLKDAKFCDARMQEVKGTHADFSGAGLSGATMTNASLKGALFSGTNFQSTNLCGAYLSEAQGFTFVQFEAAHTDDRTKSGHAIGD
jgi:uncharacterized protein YjbI with pentapeptide repeats